MSTVDPARASDSYVGFFTDNARYIISGLNTWGWIVLLLGCAQTRAAIA
jgi:hypothetical protein